MNERVKYNPVCYVYSIFKFHQIAQIDPFCLAFVYQNFLWCVFALSEPHFHHFVTLMPNFSLISLLIFLISSISFCSFSLAYFS